MQKQSILRWLVQIVATVFAITILSSVGAAAFALLGGALCWLLRVEKVPIGLVWLTASGAIAGFLTGTVWAVDQIVNWRSYCSPALNEAGCPAVPVAQRNRIQQTSLAEHPPRTAAYKALRDRLVSGRGHR